MIKWLQQWVITICTTAVLITAVEIILPDNKLRKYAKFVVGLILMTVIIQPIIKVVSKTDDVESYIINAQNTFEQNNYNETLKKSDSKNVSSIVGEFKKNLEDSCVKMLKNKYPDNDYSVTAEVNYDDSSKAVSVKSLSIGVKDRSIGKVKKVRIEDEQCDKSSDVDEKTKKEISTYVSDEIKVPYSDIKVYKL
ncbi:MULTISPECIES: stage III sporulation protein AF [Clostridium]|uniref:stage III sporulation protein AF n=1 Tax=Clostridium TaxID=1485 RepID=UPI000824ECE9|nr:MULTISPECIES: stage III sporulation protein AF [Clostridium]PJI09933.1 stage III sporulation protein AF [Clostridium sp. CT7]